MMGNILLIDDEEQLRKLLGRIISLEGYTVEHADNILHGKEILKRKDIDVLLCDVKLPDGNGVNYVKEFKERYPLSEAILLTAYGNIPDGVQAIKNGAFDYITKGTDNDRILPLLSMAMEKVNKQKKAAIRVHDGEFDFTSIIGRSRIIQESILLAKKVAATSASILLLGETGSGKEVFAQAIHRTSKRKNEGFIAINCSAFPRDLLEGELFGHKAGAYTGATKDKKGLFELADKGTLFLDEIGEMSIDLQAKLLRVLENGEFIKLGDVRTTKTDVRIIAATNRDLSESVSMGHFRQDLLFRLNTFTIQIPSLRERKEDIKELAEYFLRVFSEREQKENLKLSEEAIKALENYSWKGNVRELKNVLERAVILAEGTILTISDFNPEIQQNNAGSEKFSLSDVEKEHIRKILLYTKGNKTKAAHLLGIGLATLYRKLDEYGISK